MGRTQCLAPYISQEGDTYEVEGPLILPITGQLRISHKESLTNTSNPPNTKGRAVIRTLAVRAQSPRAEPPYGDAAIHSTTSKQMTRTKTPE